MDIIGRIKKEIHAHVVLTGREARRVYLGRNQMRALQEWAYENDYTGSASAPTEGKHRPEVAGRLCWEVNEDDHVTCA